MGSGRRVRRGRGEGGGFVESWVKLSTEVRVPLKGGGGKGREGRDSSWGFETEERVRKRERGEANDEVDWFGPSIDLIGSTAQRVSSILDRPRANFAEPWLAPPSLRVLRPSCFRDREQSHRTGCKRYLCASYRTTLRCTRSLDTTTVARRAPTLAATSEIPVVEFFHPGGAEGQKKLVLQCIRSSYELFLALSRCSPAHVCRALASLRRAS